VGYPGCLHDPASAVLSQFIYAQQPATATAVNAYLTLSINGGAVSTPTIEVGYMIGSGTMQAVWFDFYLEHGFGSKRFEIESAIRGFYHQLGR
jgi:hypothetical protein